jgi:hypothetical protein
VRVFKTKLLLNLYQILLHPKAQPTLFVIFFVNNKKIPTNFGIHYFSHKVKGKMAKMKTFNFSEELQ